MVDIAKDFDLKTLLYAEYEQFPESMNHRLEEVNGLPHWKEDKMIRMLVDCGALDLNKLDFSNKSNPLLRKLYRDLGYSLVGYWELFYWNVNNSQQS